MFCTRCGTQVTQDSKFCPSCGLDLATVTPLATGQTPADTTEQDIVRDALKEEYEILQELGRGGMAIVFRAREKQLDREVAVKVLPFSLAFDADFVERFQREARTSARLEHPNIIPIYRVGRAGRVIYFVMKFLRGTSLSDVIAQRGALPVPEIRRLLIETAKALAYAHKNGIVHRDIKPDNIMFDESGHAIVTDFGIAKAGSGTRLTGTGMAIGTPHYMSPEQARAQKLDGRSDIYSLGVVAYQCLAGQVPYDGEDAFSIGYKHITEPVPTPQLPSADHRSLFEVIRRMMAKSPDERFQSSDDAVAALEGKGMAIAAQATISLDAAATTALPGEVVRLAHPSTPTTPMPRASGLRGPRVREKRSGMLVGMIFAFALVGAGGGGAYLYYGVLRQPAPRWLQGIFPAPPQQARVGAPDSTAVAGPVADSIMADTAAPAPAPQPTAADLPNTGSLTLLGVPPRARVAVDGELKDGSPLTLDAGSRRVEITAPGYEKYSVTVAIPRGGDTAVTVRMKRPPAQPTTGAVAEGQPEEACGLPGPSYNRGDTCYDTPARATVAPLVPLDDRIQRTPTPVTLWVKVSESGRALSFQMIDRSNDQLFDRLAAGFAMSITYNPAQKNGRPVEGWTRMRLLPQAR